MGRHADFWQVTGDALDYAMASLRIEDGGLRGRLMELYLTLDAYPEVAGVLERLAGWGNEDRHLVQWRAANVGGRGQQTAGIGASFDAILSVEEVGVYKPHPSVYRLGCDRLGLPAARMSFQSSNAWDAAAAAAFGYQGRLGEPLRSTAPRTSRANPPSRYGRWIRCRTLSALAETTTALAGARPGREPAPVEFRERRFTAQDGLTLFYREYGDPAAPAIPLLCLPGLTRNSKDFDALALRYGSTRRVVCPDYRGRGLSAYDPDYRNYAPRTHLSDLLDLFAVAGLGEAIVIGTSAGGILAMALAVARPACLRGVVLNDIGPEVASAGRERIANYIGAAETPRDWAAAAAYCRDAWGPGPSRRHASRLGAHRAPDLRYR